MGAGADNSYGPALSKSFCAAFDRKSGRFLLPELT
jgi:hypothetical protein